MKTKFSIFLLLLVSVPTLLQAQVTSIEEKFKQYLVSEDQSLALTIINSKDDLYSLYCQGMNTKDVIEKINLFTSFIQKNPKYGKANAFLMRGITNAKVEKLDSAILDYSKYITMDGSEKYAYFLRGTCYYNNKDNTNALKDLNKFIELKNDDANAFMMRGLIYSSMFEYEKAIEDWKLSKKLDGSNSKNLNTLIDNANKKLKRK